MILNYIAQFFNNYWFGVLILPLVLWLTAYQLKNRKSWLLLWGTFILMQIVVWTMKFAIDSQRPIGNHALDNPSFPSGVAADAGFFATYLSIVYPKYWIVWQSLGIIIATLRIYIGAHYVGDVVVGYVLGVVIFLLAHRIFKIKNLSH